MIQEIANLRFLDEGTNLLMFGATGVGKTYLATAIGNHVCRCGRSVIFMKMNFLLEKLALARAEGTYLNFLKKIHITDLFIIDDFGIKPLTDQQYQDFYDVLGERANPQSSQPNCRQKTGVKLSKIFLSAKPSRIGSQLRL